MDAWFLVLDATGGDASRRVGGLSLALRLALDAQAGGAQGVVAPEALRALLADRRLRIPVLDDAPTDARRVRVPASYLVHRGLFKAIAERGLALDLGETEFDFDPPWGFSPVDVVDEETARDAERLLFRSLRKPQDGWTSRWLNRYLSLALSRWLARTPLTPNQISVAILGVGVAGAILASRGGYANLALGAFLFQMQSVLDGCDGEVSRVTHRGSLAGEWLDTIGDDLTNYGFFAGAALGLGSTPYLVAGTVMIACGIITSGIEYAYLIRIGSGDLLKYPLSQSTTSGTGPLATIGPLFKRDTFVLLTFLAALAGWVGPMLIVFSLGAAGILVSVIRTELRMARSPR
ncbi:MAG: CDP-alcohol phosphatidyltransferase family protein [Sorangiineae bacterium]|nr:CDP-alcohol phosphatidyltransferase family protein [Polyangiaceae bacterium]MEB2324542.1 CDP-alcohol phosphatidyltransferase family protein [Sorangiineae bacterium]